MAEYTNTSYCNNSISERCECTSYDDIESNFYTETKEKDRSTRAKRRYQTYIKEKHKKEIIENTNSVIRNMYVPGSWNSAEGMVNYPH